MRYGWAVEKIENAGHDTRLSGSELAICCPFCNDHKYRLYFNLDKGAWICFHCSERGRAPLLFAKLGISNLGLAKIVKAKPKLPPPDPSWPPHEKIRPDSRVWRYLRKRGMVWDDVVLWRLQAGIERYRDYVLWPVLDGDGKLLSVHCRRFQLNGARGLMYPAEQNRSLLGLHLIAMEARERLVLVEGPYDAAHITRQLWADEIGALALMGHNITPLQCLQLQQLGLPVTVMLDADVHEEALKLAQELARWVPTSISFLQGGDPDDLSRNELRVALSSAVNIKS